MKRAFVLLAACSSAAPPPPPRTVSPPVEGAPEPLPFPAGCVAADNPALAELQRLADDMTRMSLEAELARQKLRPLALALHQDVLAGGEGAWDVPHAPVGTAVNKKLSEIDQLNPVNRANPSPDADTEGTFVAGETHYTGSAHPPPAWEFVQDERGDVYRLLRRPRAGVTRVAICTCRAPQCGPYGSPCSACNVTYQALFGPLPPGATYKGARELAHPAYAVSLEHEERGCPPPPRCPDPPP